jgi:hypothetical protein
MPAGWIDESMRGVSHPPLTVNAPVGVVGGGDNTVYMTMPTPSVAVADCARSGTGTGVGVSDT